MSCNTLVTIADQLWPSYQTTHGTRMNLIMHHKSCHPPHDLQPVPTPAHSQAPTMFLCNNNPSHTLQFADSYFPFQVQVPCIFCYVLTLTLHIYIYIK